MIVQPAHHLVTLALPRELLHKGHVTLAFIIRPFGQFLVEPVKLFLHLADMGESLFGLLAYRVAVAQHHHLRQVTNGRATRNGNRAGGGLLQPGNDFQHRRFARPILPHKGNAVFVVNDIGHVMEQRRDPELYF